MDILKKAPTILDKIVENPQILESLLRFRYQPPPVTIEKYPPFRLPNDSQFRDGGSTPAYKDRGRTAEISSGHKSSYWNSDGETGEMEAAVAVGKYLEVFYANPSWDADAEMYRVEVEAKMPFFFTDLPPDENERLFIVEADVEIPKPWIKRQWTEGRVEIVGEIDLRAQGLLGSVSNPHSFIASTAERVYRTWITGANIVPPNVSDATAILTLRLAVACEKTPDVIDDFSVAGIDLAPSSLVLFDPPNFAGGPLSVRDGAAVTIKKAVLKVFSLPRGGQG